MGSVGTVDRILRTFASVLLLALPFVPRFLDASGGRGAWARLLPARGPVVPATAPLRFRPAHALPGVRPCPWP